MYLLRGMQDKITVFYCIFFFILQNLADSVLQNLIKPQIFRLKVLVNFSLKYFAEGHRHIFL